MTVAVWPLAAGIAEIEWGPQTASTVLASPRTGTEVIQTVPGERWQLAVHFNPLYEAEWRDLMGALLGLYGPVGQIAVPLPDYSGPRGGITGSPLATGSAGAYQLTLSSLAGADPVLRRGDLFTVGGTRLYCVTADLNRGASTSATASVWPSVRGNPSGAAVTLRSLTVPMRLQDDKQLKFLVDAPQNSTPQPIQFVEPLP